MIKRNFLTAPLKDEPNCHHGMGVLQHITLFEDLDFKSNLRFLNYTILPKDTSIGLHQHGNDEEIYVILEGEGVMLVNGEEMRVTAGDVILNPPYGEHSLVNQSSHELKILVFEVCIEYKN